MLVSRVADVAARVDPAAQTMPLSCHFVPAAAVRATGVIFHVISEKRLCLTNYFPMLLKNFDRWKSELVCSQGKSILHCDDCLHSLSKFHVGFEIDWRVVQFCSMHTLFALNCHIAVLIINYFVILENGWVLYRDVTFLYFFLDLRLTMPEVNLTQRMLHLLELQCRL